MVDQGGSFFGLAKALNPTDKDVVITRRMLHFVCHLEPGATPVQNRRPACSGMPGQSGKAIHRPGGKTHGQVSLIRPQNIDHIVTGLTKGCHIVGIVIQAPQNKRRIKRDCGKGIDGQSDRLPISIHRCHHGDARGVTSQRMAEGPQLGFGSRARKGAGFVPVPGWTIGNLGHRETRMAKTRYYPCSLRHLSSFAFLTLHFSDPGFSARLIAWQRQHGRHDLPWQETRDPYRIWLSEIMLQQTQVSAVIPYYQRFLGHFPDLASLAAAPVEAVLADWAGLGYYARARNLHACARQIMTAHHGHFPGTAEELAKLPGIGRSTAAAIAAFSFGERSAILDGNVKRVLCRHFGIAGFPGSRSVEQELWALATELLPERSIEAYTQGQMDLGATLCTRSRPRCDACPLAATCVARRDQRQNELPEARPRAARPERSTTLLMITDGQRLLLERRPPSGLWGGLLVPPEGLPQTVLPRYGLRARLIQPLPLLRHSFTHFHLSIHPLLCHVEAVPGTVGEALVQWVDLRQAEEAGVPAPVRKLIRLVGN